MSSNNNPSFLSWLRGEIETFKSSGESPNASNDNAEDKNSLSKSCSMLGKLDDLISTQQHALNVLANNGHILNKQKTEMSKEINSDNLDENQRLKFKLDLTETQKRLEIIIIRLNLLSDTMEKTLELRECINIWEKNLASLEVIEESLKCNQETKFFKVFPDETYNDDIKITHTTQSESDMIQDFIREINTSFDNLKITSNNVIYENEISKIKTNEEIVAEFACEDIEITSKDAFESSIRDRELVAKTMQINEPKHEHSTCTLSQSINRKELEFCSKTLACKIDDKDIVTTETQCLPKEIKNQLDCINNSESSDDSCNDYNQCIQETNNKMKMSAKNILLDKENIEVKNINETTINEVCSEF